MGPQLGLSKRGFLPALANAAQARVSVSRYPIGS
jgi:hypothetical protein